MRPGPIAATGIFTSVPSARNASRRTVIITADLVFGFTIVEPTVRTVLPHLPWQNCLREKTPIPP
ncbi:MAG: hypothetical protein U1U88_002045 [Lawsonella clevelandensis]